MPELHVELMVLKRVPGKHLELNIDSCAVSNFISQTVSLLKLLARGVIEIVVISKVSIN
jgi:hypothetical protein